MSEKVEHGIAGGYYSFHPAFPKLRAVLECLCGWDCRGSTWQDAGEQLDEHLEETK